MVSVAWAWLVTVGVVAAAVSAGCPSSEWILYDGYCYWRSPFTVQFEEGEHVCHTEFAGSHMVSIHHYPENAFVFGDVMQDSPAWIGFERGSDSEPWRWSDGSADDWTIWCAGEPAGWGERLAFMHPNHRGCWTTTDANSFTHVVCKIPEQT